MKPQITLSLVTVMLSSSLFLNACHSGETPKTAPAADSTAQKSNAAQADMYVCPMHPEEKSDKPGKCSKCGMDLEKKS